MVGACVFGVAKNGARVRRGVLIGRFGPLHMALPAESLGGQNDEHEFPCPGADDKQCRFQPQTFLPGVGDSVQDSVGCSVGDGVSAAIVFAERGGQTNIGKRWC